MGMIDEAIKRIEVGADGNPHILSISNSISNSSGLYAKSLEELNKCDYIDRSRKSYTKDKVIAMFEELKTEIEKIAEEEKYHDAKWALGLNYSKKIIQQKINALKGEK